MNTCVHYNDTTSALLLRQQVLVVAPRRCPLRLFTQVVAAEPTPHVELDVSQEHLMLSEMTLQFCCLIRKGHPDDNHTWRLVRPTYHTPLAVGVVCEQVLARKRQVVRADAVAGRLALLDDTGRQLCCRLG